MTDYRMDDVQQRIVRDCSDLTLFDDLFTTPDYLGYYVDNETGVFVLQFSADLTAAQLTDVKDRITHTPEQEAVIKQARQALTALRNQITDPALANTTWTTAQLSGRVRLLGQICEGLVKLAIDDTTA